MGRKGTVTALASIALALSVTSAALAHDSELSAALAEAMESDAPPAMGVAVIRGYEISDPAVRGVRRLGSPASVRPDDRWQLGSDVKAFTATLIARLVERGQLSWDTPLHRLLPEQAAVMRPEFRHVTLLDLLSHRAGLADLIAADPLFLSFYEDDRPSPQQRMAWANALLSRPPVVPSRAEPRYSNTGFIIAAAVAERATGMSYENLVRREILRPLGLRTATFAAPRPGREPVGHVDGRPAGRRDANPPVMNPSSNLRLSLRDWAIFCLDQMAGEQGRGRLLSRASYQLLHRSQGGTGEGLGWAVAPSIAGRRGPVIQHIGHDGNWFAAVALFPERGDGILLVANGGRSMNGEEAVMRVAMRLLSTLSDPAG